MCSFETIWLQVCHNDQRALLYRRYFDETWPNRTDNFKEYFYLNNLT